MSFESNYENACKVIEATGNVAKFYREIHFWEVPNDGTFTAKLCKELNMAPTEENVKKILAMVDEWNIHKTLKALYKGETAEIRPMRKSK